ncbi:MAG: hypothetical protein WD470_10265 [Rhodospirillaceae bacterium]
MTDARPLTDTQLDAALDRLVAPAPSAELESRVKAFAPQRYRAPARKAPFARIAIAASLAAAVASGVLLQVAFTEVSPVVEAAVEAGIQSGSPTPVTASEEIRPPEIALVDPSAWPAGRESYSMAGLPLD